MKSHVDIIIPAYNPGAEIIDAVISCYKQSYDNFTVTVIDDNSDEPVERLLSDFQGINYIRNDKNLGPGGARNVGIRATSGEYISLLDSDDIMMPDKLALSVAELQADPDVGLVCGNYRRLINRSRLLPPFYRRPIKVDYESLMRQNFVASGSTTFRRSAAEDVGLFSEKYFISEDFDMWLRISEEYKVKYIHDILYYYSVVPSGSSLTQREDLQSSQESNIAEIKTASRNRIREKSLQGGG
jgi:glycosyltransferase involved in cell wall biosynthesis